MDISSELIQLIANTAADAAYQAATAHCPEDAVTPTVGLALAVAAVASAQNESSMTLEEFQAFAAEIWNSPTHDPS